MTGKGKYASGCALRAALEERLKQLANSEDTETQRLRRQVAFDRFLARIFQDTDSQWVLKGGYAMELRFQMARATKDLAFTVRTTSRSSGDVYSATCRRRADGISMISFPSALARP